MLPLFPLNIVIFPGEELALKVVENRYRNMLQKCHDKNADLGVIFCEDYEKELQTMAKTGCLAKVATVENLEDGSLGVVLQGVDRFVIKSIKEQKDVFYAEKTSKLKDKIDLQDNDPVIKSARAAVDGYLDILADIDPTMIKGGLGTVLRPEDSFKIIDQIILPEEKRQTALELSSAKKRYELATAYLQRELETLRFLMIEPDEEMPILVN